MRKTLIVSLLLSLILAAVISAEAQTRARRVGQTSPSQTATPQPAPTTQKRPVLLGGTTMSSGNRQPAPSSSSPQSQAPATDEAEEVDEGDVVRVNTTLVTIPVTVMDRNGRFVPGVRREEFRIYEDGVAQEVAYYASVDKPFTVALVLDTSGSTRFRLEEIQDAAISFVNQLRPDDRVIVVSFDDEVRVLAEATSDRYVLRDAIRRTRAGGSTRLYDAVDLVINQRLNREQGRKAVVLFTDGVDTGSRYATYQGNLRDAEELDALIFPVQYDTYNDMGGGGGGGGGGNWPQPQPNGRRRSSGNILIDILGDVMSNKRRRGRSSGGGGGAGGGAGGGGGGGVIWGGGGSGPGGSPEDYRRADAYLNDLAYRTGARLYRADTTSDLSQSFAMIAEELRRQYSIGYYPKNTAQAGQRRQIKVRVMRPDLVVRARDSYIAGSPTGDVAAQGGTQQPQKPELRKRQLVEVRE